MLHDIPRFFIFFIEQLFFIFNQMLSIRVLGRSVLYHIELQHCHPTVKCRSMPLVTSMCMKSSAEDNYSARFDTPRNPFVYIQ